MTPFNERTVGKLLSLLTLAVGMVMGFVGRGVLRPSQSVQAQAVVPPSPTFKDVTPAMIGPSIGSNLILAHEIAADSIVINGFDILKMQQNILEYLASQPGAERASVENVINASKATTIYRLKQPTLPSPVQPSTEKR